MKLISVNPILLISYQPVTTATRFSGGINNLIQPAFLYTATCIFATLTAIVVSETFRTLNIKMKKGLFKKSVDQTLQQWITEMIVSDRRELLKIPENFENLFKNAQARQITIDKLVQNKSSFLGSVSENIISLYYQLGLNVDSRLKLDDHRTHVQCQGIRELCVMEQKDQLQKVYRLTNSAVADVRIEAQSAILQWYGFKGLRFLDLVSSPITEFQQLKLLELLRQLPFSSMPRLSNWLQSKNDTVVCFALKLAEHYKQAQVTWEVEQCLQHKNEAVRVQAVKTLTAIANSSSTARLLTVAYQTERFTNRLNILKELQKIAGNEQRDFLIVQLHQAHDYLKLEAAKVLAKCTEDGMEILEAKSYDQPDPYHDIYLHVKAELAQ